MTSRPRSERAVPVLLLVTLLLTSTGVLLLKRDKTALAAVETLTLPHAVTIESRTWTGEDLAHTEAELAILAPAQVIKREYSHSNLPVIWVTAMQTPNIGGLHNVYDSLVASGARPRIVENITLNAISRPLKMTRLDFQDRHGNRFHGLLWYQWPDGTARDRWDWYASILRERLRGHQPPWRLVIVSTPQSEKPEESLARLLAFTEVLYRHTLR